MLTEEQIEQYKREHGELVQITVPPHNGADQEQVLLFKRAAPAVWADYQESITKEKGTTAAFRRLSYACAVHPDAKQLEEVFRRYPALPTKIANSITNMSGVGDEFEVKKL